MRGASTARSSSLAACGAAAYYTPDVATTYLTEAIELVRASGDRSQLCAILSYLAVATHVAGQPIASQLAAEEGRDVADAVGDAFMSRHCRVWLATALVWERGLADGADAMTRTVADEARVAGERMLTEFGLLVGSFSLAHQGKVAEARERVKEAHEASMAMGGFHEDTVYGISAF